MTFIGGDDDEPPRDLEQYSEDMTSCLRWSLGIFLLAVVLAIIFCL